MTGYALKRLLLFIPTLVLVSLIIFFFMRVIPGDPAIILLAGETGEGSYTEEELAAVRKKLGTDRPMLVQYGSWMWGLVRGNLGMSMYYDEPVIDELKRRLPITLELALMAVIISFIISVPLGVLSAVKQDTWIDYGARLFAIFGITLPTFWVGILVVFFLAGVFDWLPPWATLSYGITH